MKPRSSLRAVSTSIRWRGIVCRAAADRPVRARRLRRRPIFPRRCGCRGPCATGVVTGPPRRCSLGGVLLGGEVLGGRENACRVPLHDHEQGVHERLGARRAAGHVDVDRDDLVDALHHVVAVGEGAGAHRARSHRDDVLGERHLLVQELDARSHLQVDGAGDDHAVGLARRVAEEDAVALGVVARRAHRHHLDRAAGGAKGQRPHRVSPRPVHEELQRRDEDLGLFVDADVAHDHFSAPLRHA